MTEPSPEIAKARKDEAKMREAIVLAIMTWAELENDLARFLDQLLEAPRHDAGKLLYYAPTNTETRLALVDAIVVHCVPYMPRGEEIATCWTKLLSMMSRAKNTRNAIVHGNVRTYGKEETGKFFVRLHALVLDVARMRKTWKGYQLPVCRCTM